LDDIPELIAGARRAGLAANATIMVDRAAAAPPQLATGAFRILQEALTNVLRHAPGAPADITLRGGPGVGLAIQVVNPLHPQPPPSPGSGTGLTGVHERVTLLGGTLSAGASEQKVFVLQAWLPWPA
jgi:signal transduction histidine kinase